MFQKIKNGFKKILSNIKNTKPNGLTTKIWLFLISFSIIILLSLWLFQTLFLGTYYKYRKTNDLNQAASELKEDNNYLSLSAIEEIAKSRDICIEIYGANSSYISSIYNQGCMEFGNKNFKVKKDFLNSGLEEQHYSLINQDFKKETLIYALKLDSTTYAFINASIEPLDSTIQILSSQFIYTTIGVLILSLIVGYFISKSISKPIIQISENARKLADRNFSTDFTTNSNIYEINELTDSLNYAKEELSKTEKLQRDLMANVGHDLKTPLTMIKAYAELIRDINYDKKEKREENLNTIIEETDRLTLLVNDILDLSALQAKATPLKIEKIDLNDLIYQIIDKFNILTVKEQYNFVFNHPDKVIVEADYKRIYQVIYNLVNNAINYTGEDKTVTINTKNQKDTYLIEIIDTGKGIKKEELAHIWDRYYHSDKKHKRNSYGTGLGLSIVKQILQSHGSNYGVKTSRNQKNPNHKTQKGVEKQMKEIEILVELYSDIQEAKQTLNQFKSTGIKNVIDTYYYDPLRNNLKPNNKLQIDECFRLREQNDKTYITYKIDKFDDNNIWLYSDEYETEVKNKQQIINIINALGLKKLLVINNKKTSYTTNKYEIVIEEVDKLGNFMEVELCTNENVNVKEIKREIQAFINSLGLDVSEELHMGKPEMMLKKGLFEDYK